MTSVALGLGSNKSFSNLRPQEILGAAVFELSKILSDIKISSVYRTKAMYVTDQDDFYNMALVGRADGISARGLLEKIHKIEAAFGRDRSKEIRFGARSLDIDIEFFGAQKIAEPDLEIPHPRLKERAFVLVPLLEVLEKSADNVREEVFCLNYEELALSLAALGDAKNEVQKIISAEDFFQFVKEVDFYGRCR